MMLVIYTAGKVKVNDTWEDRACAYKIINCPELTQSQQDALVGRLTPLIAQSPDISNGNSDMPIAAWSLESDDFVTPSEIQNRLDSNDPTWSEPVCEYLDAIVWSGIGQKAFTQAN